MKALTMRQRRWIVVAAAGAMWALPVMLPAAGSSDTPPSVQVAQH